MAVSEKVLGSNLYMIYNSVVVGCAKNFNLNISADELDAACSGNGTLSQAIPGRKKVTFDFSGLWRQTTGADVSTNKTVAEFFDDIMSNTGVTVVFGLESPATGDITYTGTGYLKDLNLSANDNEIGSYTGSGYLNTLTKTVAA